ncbi:hypothetical protein D3C71_1783260 [compost metagenome]
MLKDSKVEAFCLITSRGTLFFTSFSIYKCILASNKTAALILSSSIVKSNAVAPPIECPIMPTLSISKLSILEFRLDR